MRRRDEAPPRAVVCSSEAPNLTANTRLVVRGRSRLWVEYWMIGFRPGANSMRCERGSTGLWRSSSPTFTACWWIQGTMWLSMMRDFVPSRGFCGSVAMIGAATPRACGPGEKPKIRGQLVPWNVERSTSSPASGERRAKQTV